MRLLSRLVTATTVLTLLASTPLAAHANHVQDVLGEQIETSEIHFPAVSAGPGFILPDSSLYPVDQFVQEVRLLLAFTPEQQSIVHMRIAGERMSELRAMVGRNNNHGIATALAGLEKEANSAAKSLADANTRGRGNLELTRQTNDTLGEYRRILASVAQQAPETLAYKIESARQNLYVAKAKVEDQLPENELIAAIDNDLSEEIDTQVLGIQTAAAGLEKRVNLFQERASKATEFKLKYEEAHASKSAMKKEQKELRMKTIEEYKAKRQEMMDARKKKMEEFKAAVKRAQELAKEIREMQMQEKQLSVQQNVTPTITP